MTAGRNLEPTKLSIKPGNAHDISPSSKPDKFGQVNSSDKDQAAGGTPSARESVNQHARSDVDASRKSQHHTLGTGANQGAPGNHVHDGVNGKKLGLYKMDPANNGNVLPSLTLTGAKGSNVALTNLIALLKNFIDFNDNTTA